MTVLASFFFPGELMTNLYFLGSVFIAFATLFPNIEFRIYFILPVKAKWLGWFTAVAYLAMLVLGGNHLGNRLCIFVALFNYALFFGGDFVRGLKSGKRKKEFIAEPKLASSSALHVCSVCGITDQDDGMMSFRYCSTCGECFCEAHMDTHQHS